VERTSKRFVEAIKRRGYKSVRAFAIDAKISVSGAHQIKNGSVPDENMDAICQKLQIDAKTWLYGSDDEFEAMLAGEDLEAQPSRPYILDSAIEEDFVATGPNAWRHWDAEHLGAPALALDQGRGLRSGRDTRSRVVDLAGVAFGHEVWEFRAERPRPIIVNGQAVDFLVPGQILVVDPDSQPLEGDLVITKSDGEDDAETLDTRMMRYHAEGAIRWVIPLDEDPDRVGRIGRGREIAGVVIERRQLRSPLTATSRAGHS
jgi:hypothetical protein